MNDDLDRPQMHNPSIDEGRARQGECARVHLPSGTVCTQPQQHAGSCEFVIADAAPPPAPAP